MNYYNEINPYAADCLRNLIANGLIPAGDVAGGNLDGSRKCNYAARCGDVFEWCLIKETQMEALLVTAQHRGVFFGYSSNRGTRETITLKNARNCLYWRSQDTKGFVGLATVGPDSDCRVGPAVDELVLYDITAVAPVTVAAAAQWEAAPWS